MLGGNRASRRCQVIAVTAALGLVAAGCGEGGESTAGEERTFAVGNELPEVFAERTAKLIETTTKKADCAPLETINSRSLTRFECPPSKQLRQSMASFEVVAAKDYGTGAIVDYKSGQVKDGAAIVLFVIPDRNWGIARFGVVTKPSVGTSDADSRDGYEKVVDSFLTAVEERDCDTYFKVTFHGDSTKKEACGPPFEATAKLAKRMKADPGATPRYEGGNGTYGFYSLETSKPVAENVTIAVVKAGVGANADYLVLDIGPSPTADEQRQARESLKRQLKEGPSNGGMSPSDSKPSEPAVPSAPSGDE